MRTICHFAFFIIFLMSCNNSQRNILILENEKLLKATEYKNEIVSVSPLDIMLIENNLFLFQGHGENAAIILNTENGNQLGTWGKRGNGPGEFTYPIYWNNNGDSIYLYDLNRFTLRLYNTIKEKNNISLSQIDEKNFDSKIASIRSATVLESGNIIASAIYGLKEPLLLLNSNMDSLYCFGSITNDQTNIDLRSFSGTLSSYKNKFVYAMVDLGYIACYEETKNGEIKKNWEYYTEKPFYNNNKIDNRLLKKGFMDIKMTKNYIFCSYIGKTVTPDHMNVCPENILVFNHQGDLISNFRTDREIGKIAISKDEKTIYATSFEPDISIVKYNIDLN